MSEVLAGNPGRVVQKRAQRRDGWSKTVRTAFLDSLAATGNVTFSAGAVGRTHNSAYGLRRRDPRFAAAWEEALAEAYVRIEAELLARAIGGEPVEYTPGDGEIVRPPFDEKLAMSMMTRQDTRTAGRYRARPAMTRHATLAEVEVSLRRKLDALAKRRKGKS